MNDQKDLGVSAITPPRFPLQSSAEDGERISTSIADARERPILFSSPMVRAILDGSKTQTRRIVKLPKEASPHATLDHIDVFGSAVFTDGSVVRAFATAGTRLWVRETFTVVGYDKDRDQILGKAGPPDEPWWGTRPAGKASLFSEKWRPSLFMPRWASRITLEVVSIRVERLASISQWDARQEGIRGEEWSAAGEVPTTAFQRLWESINGSDSWDTNPWVWVVGFRKLPQP